MNRDDIILIRIVSVAVLLAALTFVLIFGCGQDIYSQLANEINAGSIQTGTESFPLYAMLYYQGFAAIYEVFYGITLYGCLLGCIGIFLRLRAVSVITYLGSIAGIFTGILLILSVVFEGSYQLHNIFSYIYLGEGIMSTSTEYALSLLGIRPVIVGCVLIVLGLLAVIIIKTSGMSNIKSYRSVGPLTALSVAMPVIYGLIYIPNIRDYIMNNIVALSNQDEMMREVLNNYYFRDQLIISIKPIYLILVAAVIGIILMRINMRRSIIKVICVLLTVLVYTVAGILCVNTAPPIFGYISIEPAVCDELELLSILRIVQLTLDAAILGIITVLSLDFSKNATNNKMLTITAISMIISIAVVIIGSSVSLFVSYVALIVISFIQLLCLLKLTNIRRSN